MGEQVSGGRETTGNLWEWRNVLPEFSVFGKWKTDGPSESAGDASPLGRKKGLPPLPISRGLSCSVLSRVMCQWPLGAPRAGSLPGAGWEQARGAQSRPGPCACCWGLFAQGHLVSIQ